MSELDTSVFNDEARLAVEWTAERIGTTARHWLDGLPETRVESGFTLAHGSPRDPLWEYLVSASIARRNLSHFETAHAIVGHTHVPLVFREAGGRIEVIHPREGTRLELDERRCIINPGGVGQPRAWQGCRDHILRVVVSGTIELVEARQELRRAVGREAE